MLNLFTYLTQKGAWLFTFVNFICSIFDIKKIQKGLKDTGNDNFKVKEVSGRYLTNEHISSFLGSLDNRFKVEVIGKSVQQRPIKSITFGEGPIRIFMWSQMHGNESTTTKAVLDLLNFFNQPNPEAASYAKSCTIKVIPILNPDGAKAYTRVNGNEIDLNRDAQDLTQPESIVLKDCFDAFKPHYCYNLHDQRTIYNVGRTNKPATISFLAPALDKERSISPSRKVSMQLIAGMNRKLRETIPGQVGRYDDSFNPNCVGDTFQMSNTPTILFEAGHFPEDYAREKTRDFIFIALKKSIEIISSNEISDYSVQDYADIPENGKLFYDIIIKNAEILDNSIPTGGTIGILYTESLYHNEISFEPTIASKSFKESEFFGHRVVDCLNKADLKWIANSGISALFK